MIQYNNFQFQSQWKSLVTLVKIINRKEYGCDHYHHYHHNQFFLWFTMFFCSFKAPFLPEFFYERDNSRNLNFFNSGKKILSDEEIDAYRYTFTKG